MLVTSSVFILCTSITPCPIEGSLRAKRSRIVVFERIAQEMNVRKVE